MLAALSVQAGISYTRYGPTLYTLTATACNQPNAGACPNTATPTANYIERRLSVAF